MLGLGLAVNGGNREIGITDPGNYEANHKNQYQNQNEIRTLFHIVAFSSHGLRENKVGKNRTI
ncbi:hypothetical protein [Motiliproteus sp.]|uniref:hypothetical protein n=1 Tax=Motiliproteus sp. TaxID=1898955 RepID=UPI003BAA8AF2